jgi:hypothetical protein
MQFLRVPSKLAGQGYEVGPCTGSVQECSRVSLENLRRSAGRETLAHSVRSFGTLMIACGLARAIRYVLFPHLGVAGQEDAGRGVGQRMATELSLVSQ